MTNKIDRVTRKQVKACARFFPGLYSLTEYDHGFEVIRVFPGEGTRSVLFRNDGVAIRTDVPGITPRVGVNRGARILGMR